MRRLGDPLFNRLGYRGVIPWGNAPGGYGGALPYYQRVLNTASANLLSYWPLWETVGAVADNLEGTAARDGGYGNITLNDTLGPDGVNGAPFWDGPGTTARCNINKASVVATFPADEATVMLWFKVFNAGVWTDGTTRYLLSFRSTPASDLIFIQKAAVNNRVTFQSHDENHNQVISTLDWTQLVMTWSIAADEVNYYVNGAFQVQDVGLGAWVGALNPVYSTIGAQTQTGTADFHGWIAHVAMWNTPLTAPQIAELAVV